jgi:hypothetical protein
MSAGMTELTARDDISCRRHGQRLGDVAVAACRGFVEAARAVDNAVVARSAAQCRRELSADEDAQLETTEAGAWEALFIAALRFDDQLPDHAAPAAEWVKVSASIHARPEGEWRLWPCRGEDGTTYPAYFQDGRGRVEALLTADGDVIRGGWACHRGPLPMPPRSTS